MFVNKLINNNIIKQIYNPLIINDSTITSCTRSTESPYEILSIDNAAQINNGGLGLKKNLIVTDTTIAVADLDKKIILSGSSIFGGGVGIEKNLIIIGDLFVYGSTNIKGGDYITSGLNNILVNEVDSNNTQVYYNYYLNTKSISIITNQIKVITKSSGVYILPKDILLITIDITNILNSYDLISSPRIFYSYDILRVIIDGDLTHIVNTYKYQGIAKIDYGLKHNYISETWEPLEADVKTTGTNTIQAFYKDNYISKVIENYTSGTITSYSLIIDGVIKTDGEYQYINNSLLTYYNKKTFSYTSIATNITFLDYWGGDGTKPADPYDGESYTNYIIVRDNLVTIGQLIIYYSNSERHIWYKYSNDNGDTIVIYVIYNYLKNFAAVDDYYTGTLDLYYDVEITYYGDYSFNKTIYFVDEWYDTDRNLIPKPEDLTTFEGLHYIDIYLYDISEPKIIAEYYEEYTNYGNYEDYKYYNSYIMCIKGFVLLYEANFSSYLLYKTANIETVGPTGININANMYNNNLYVKITYNDLEDVEHEITHTFISDSRVSDTSTKWLYFLDENEDVINIPEHTLETNEKLIIDIKSIELKAILS